MSYIGAIYEPADMAHTNWSRPQLFYTLFTVIGHCLYGLNGLNPELRASITKSMVGKLRMFFNEMSVKYDDYASEVDKGRKVPDEFSRFITMSRRGTTDTGARVERAEFICKNLIVSLA